MFHPWHAGDEVARLERGEVDLVIAVTSFFGASLRTQPLGSFPYAVLMRRDHPASTEPLNLDRWLAFPHVVVSGRGDPCGSVDAARAPVGRRRRVAAVAPSFLHALELLCQTDLIATFPTGVLASSAAAHLVARAPPVSIEPVSLHLVRHRRTDPDAMVTLVAGLISLLAQDLLAQTTAMEAAER